MFVFSIVASQRRNVRLARLAAGQGPRGADQGTPALGNFHIEFCPRAPTVGVTPLYTIQPKLKILVVDLVYHFLCE